MRRNPHAAQSTKVAEICPVSEGYTRASVYWRLPTSDASSGAKLWRGGRSSWIGSDVVGMDHEERELSPMGRAHGELLQHRLKDRTHFSSVLPPAIKAV